MKIKLLSAVTAVILLCSFGTCYADVQYKVGDGVYILEGRGEAYEGNVLSALVTHTDEETQTTVTDHASYITTDEQGNFVYSFALPEDTPSAIYTIELFATGVGNVYTDTFSHADMEKKQDIIDGLNGEKAPEAALSEAVLYSMVSYPEGNLKNWPESWTEQQKQMVYKQIENTEFTIDNCVVKINEIYAVTMLEYADKDSIQNIIDENMDSLAFDSLDDYYTYYTENKENVNSLILANTITDIEQSRIIFKEAVVIDQINHAASPGGIVDIINANSALFDEAVTELESDRLSKLAANIIDSRQNGNKMKTMADIIGLIPEKGQSVVSRPGGGGGGGSSSVGGGGAGVAVIPSAADAEVTPSGVVSFADINEAEWAREAIEALVKEDILNGYENGDFKPNNNITREEFVKVIISAFEIATQDGTSEFTDVDAGHWALKYINAAKNNGIVSGISESEFGLGANITRQDMAVMLANAAYGRENVSYSDALSFTDSDNIAAYAKNAVGMLFEAKVIGGYEDGSFMPNSNATRAEAAQMIYKLIK